MITYLMRFYLKMLILMALGRFVCHICLLHNTTDPATAGSVLVTCQSNFNFARVNTTFNDHNGAYAGK